MEKRRYLQYFCLLLYTFKSQFRVNAFYISLTNFDLYVAQTRLRISFFFDPRYKPKNKRREKIRLYNTSNVLLIQKLLESQCYVLLKVNLYTL